MERILKNIGYALALAAVTPSCGSSEPSPDGAGVVAAGEQASDEDGGYETYMIRCAACHGDAAQGTSVAPPLQHASGDYATWVIRNGRAGTGMLPFSELVVDAEELREILNWLRSFEKPQTGRALYALYCGHCHGTEAAGGVTQRSLLPVVDSSDLIYSYIRMGAGENNYRDQSSYMPAWNQEELTDHEIDQIIGYLQSL